MERREAERKAYNEEMMAKWEGSQEKKKTTMRR
jgi:hypothetical protein